MQSAPGCYFLQQDPDVPVLLFPLCILVLASVSSSSLVYKNKLYWCLSGTQRANMCHRVLWNTEKTEQYIKISLLQCKTQRFRLRAMNVLTFSTRRELWQVEFTCLSSSWNCIPKFSLLHVFLPNILRGMAWRLEVFCFGKFCSVVQARTATRWVSWAQREQRACLILSFFFLSFVSFRFCFDLFSGIML